MRTLPGHLPTSWEPAVAWAAKQKCQLVSRVPLFATPGTIACRAPLSLGLSRQEYWSGLLFTSPSDLPNSGIGVHCRQTLLSEPPRKPSIYSKLDLSGKTKLLWIEYSSRKSSLVPTSSKDLPFPSRLPTPLPEPSSDETRTMP